MIRSRGGRPGETGSASVYVLTIAFVVVAVAVGLGGVAVVRIAQARAASAADLAALAAAAAHARGDDGCVRADAVARGGGAARVECTVGPDGVVSVAVEIPLQGALARFGPARARARAGPAGVDEPAG